MVASKKRIKTGVRERARLDSLARLVSAARHLFVEEGYDAATLRKIADGSNLALGTLFHYISDKRDLIYLIFNEEVDKLTDKALAAPRPSESFRDKILSITEPHYRFLARDPALSRILLSEIQQQSPGLHLERYLQIRGRLIRGFESLVIEAQKSGEIKLKEDPKVIALTVFFNFSAAARWWLATPTPNWRVGQKDFERILNIIVEGLSHASARQSMPNPRKRRQLKP